MTSERLMKGFRDVSERFLKASEMCLKGFQKPSERFPAAGKGLGGFQEVFKPNGSSFWDSRLVSPKYGVPFT